MSASNKADLPLPYGPTKAMERGRLPLADALADIGTPPLEPLSGHCCGGADGPI
jgi:hypothetical protein